MQSRATSDEVAREGVYTSGMTEFAFARDKCNTTGRYGLVWQRLTYVDTEEEESAMTTTEAPPASEAAGNIHVQSFHKHTLVAIAKLLLVTGFVLASGSAATATLTLSMNNHIPSASNLAAPSCGGEKPGFCPNPIELSWRP